MTGSSPGQDLPGDPPGSTTISNVPSDPLELLSKLEKENFAALPVNRCILTIPSREVKSS